MQLPGSTGDLPFGMYALEYQQLFESYLHQGNRCGLGWRILAIPLPGKVDPAEPAIRLGNQLQIL